jgi:DNA repair protein RadD
MLAGLVQRTCTEYPQTRHLILSHVKELLEQDHAAIRRLWPTAPVGLFSAGLNRRDTLHPIVIGGCASVRNCVDRFGRRDFCIIDEAHLLSPTAETTYQKIIAKLREANPNLIVVGLTATPYRRGIGSLLNGGIFDSMAIDLTDAKSWARFIAEGYLVPLHAKRTEASIDVSGVGISNGDFAEGQLQAASDKEQLNESIAKEIAVAMRSRKAALVFCAGIEHAEHMAIALNAEGVNTRAVHSRLSPQDRAAILSSFMEGRLDAITNNNVLTTGFDCPRVDLIGMARATVSVGLWVQMLGRGTRPAPCKDSCLVLDFAGNRPRLGPVDAPHIPKPKKGEKTGEIPCKICEHCGCYAHISARVCEACGEPFPTATKLKQRAGEQAIMSGEAPIVETFNVSRVTYARHVKKLDGAVSIRVTYMCGYKHFSRWINFDAPKNKHFAREWWRQFVGDDIPENNDDALTQLTKGVAVSPKKVRVWTNRQFPEIMGYEL